MHGKTWLESGMTLLATNKLPCLKLFEFCYNATRTENILAENLVNFTQGVSSFDPCIDLLSYGTVLVRFYCVPTGCEQRYQQTIGMLSASEDVLSLKPCETEF